MVHHPIVSADDHIDMQAIPPNLFRDRLPARYRDECPQVRQTPNGNYWFGEGAAWPFFSGTSSGRLPLPDAYTRAGLEDDGFRASNPKLRMQDMDRDGISAQVIYGPVRGFPLQNMELKAATLQVFNDWAMDFNSASPHRLCMLPILPMHSPQAAAEELQRCARIGHRGALVSIYEASIPICEIDWEPLWDCAEDVELPLSFHLAEGTWLFKSALGRWRSSGVRTEGSQVFKSMTGSWRSPAFATVIPMQMDEALVGMVFCGALERHPKLRLVLAEGGIGWIPHILERMDAEFIKFRDMIKDVRLTMTPKEVFKRQVMVTFQEDALASLVIPMIGSANVMWASDFPHPDGTFPNSLEAVEHAVKGLDQQTRSRVTYENAASLFKLRP